MPAQLHCVGLVVRRGIPPLRSQLLPVHVRTLRQLVKGACACAGLFVLLLFRAGQVASWPLSTWPEASVHEQHCRTRGKVCSQASSQQLATGRHCAACGMAWTLGANTGEMHLAPSARAQQGRGKGRWVGGARAPGGGSRGMWVGSAVCTSSLCLTGPGACCQTAACLHRTPRCALGCFSRHMHSKRSCDTAGRACCVQTPGLCMQCSTRARAPLQASYAGSAAACMLHGSAYAFF